MSFITATVSKLSDEPHHYNHHHHRRLDHNHRHPRCPKTPPRRRQTYRRRRRQQRERLETSLRIPQPPRNRPKLQRRRIRPGRSPRTANLLHVYRKKGAQTFWGDSILLLPIAQSAQTKNKTIKNFKNQIVIGSCTLAVILLVMVATATGSVLKRRTARRRQADAAATNPPSADRRSVLWTRFFPSGDSLGTASPTGLEVSAC